MSSLCSSHIYAPQSYYQASKKPETELSWFSVALRNIIKEETEANNSELITNGFASPSEAVTSPSPSSSTTNSSAPSPVPPAPKMTSDASISKTSATVEIRDSAPARAAVAFKSVSSASTSLPVLEPVGFSKVQDVKQPDGAALDAANHREISHSHDSLDDDDLTDAQAQHDTVDSISAVQKRKTLTSIFLEKKYQTGENDKDRAVKENDASVLQPARTLVTIPQHEFGPVRQSLLNLVMEEDVPLLMEAMAEKLEFEFEDLNTNGAANTSEGILRTSAKQRSKPPKQARIGFHQTPPSVFTYPDEASASEESQWDEGEHITYEHYQKLCVEERERLLREKNEIEQFLRSALLPDDPTAISFKRETVMEDPTPDECLLGVTGRISYPDDPLARYNRSNRSLIAGK